MKYTYRPTDKLQIEFEASTDKEAIKILASCDEVHGASKRCGHCGSDDIAYILRTNSKGHQFPELLCRKCRYKLAFGQNSDGRSIFPRRRFHAQHPSVKAQRSEEGDYIGHEGWELFKSRDED